MLDDDMRQVVDTQRLGYVASVCPDGTPEPVAEGHVAVWDDDHLVFAHIHSPGTVANIEAGNAVRRDQRGRSDRAQGLPLQGPAAVHRDGPTFDRALRFYFDPERSRSEAHRGDRAGRGRTRPGSDVARVRRRQRRARSRAALVDDVRPAPHLSVELKDAEPLVVGAAQHGHPTDIGDVERRHAHGSTKLGRSAAVASTSALPK